MRLLKSYIQKIKKQNPQQLIFRCSMTHLIYSLKKLGMTFKLQKELIITEKNHDEIYANNRRDKRDECLIYVECDVLCTASSYITFSRYSNATEDGTGLGMKDCLSSPGFGWKYFKRLGEGDDEPIYTYNDKYMRSFVRQNINGGNV